MKIQNIKLVAGPNIYTHGPVMIMKLRLQDLADTSSCDIPGFNERLLALLPGLR
jgi:cyanophycin synthetase